MEDSKDTLGDRLKHVEQQEAGRRAMSGIPLMARLDGRAFHTFTRGLQRPYDRRMSQLMIDTTRYLVEKTHARALVIVSLMKSHCFGTTSQQEPKQRML